MRRTCRDEYRVVQLREGLIGGTLPDNTVKRLLNKEADDGWQLESTTAADMVGRRRGRAADDFRAAGGLTGTGPASGSDPDTVRGP